MGWLFKESVRRKNMINSSQNHIKRLVILVLFTIAFAYIESAVVVYLRAIFYHDGFNFPITNILSLQNVKSYIFIEGRCTLYACLF